MCFIALPHFLGTSPDVRLCAAMLAEDNGGEEGGGGGSKVGAAAEAAEEIVSGVGLRRTLAGVLDKVCSALVLHNSGAWGE